MSHVATIEIEIKDLVALRAACVELGLELMEHQKTYRCWGTGKQLDDLTSYQKRSGKQLMPDGWTLSEMGQCDHAIRVKGDTNGYEIGLARRRDGGSGYLLLCDISGAYGIRQHADTDFGKLKQGYAVEVAVRAAKRAGFRVLEKKVRTDGSVAIRTGR